MKKRLSMVCMLVVWVSAGHALEFSDTVFFGDSLTDSGAFLGHPDAVADAKFTTSPGPMWSELLADFFGHQALANNPNNPEHTDPRGTNYAQGGAQVVSPIGIGQTPSPRSAMPIRAQVDTYLDTAGQADPNALYSLWGGANDVFFNMDQALSGMISVDMALANVAGSAQDLIAEVERLTAAGARYVLVPNLPDIGHTPAMLLQVVYAAGMGHPQQDEAVLAAATVLAVGGPNVEQVWADALAAAESVLGYPAGSLTPSWQQLVDLSTGLAVQFNQSLLAAANASQANIIPLDIFGMIGEIMADPAAFGLLNVTGTACTVSTSLLCDQDTLVDPRAPQLFLFADGVHPTLAGQRLMADYALSVLVAPALIANLAEAPLAMLQGHRHLLEQQLQAGFGSNWSVFASGGMGWDDWDLQQAWKADGSSEYVLLGGAKRLSAQWVVGAALDRVWSDVDFAQDFGGFELNGTNLSLFADYKSQRVFAHFIGTLGLQTDLDDIERVIHLGAGTRLERGHTKADVYALNALLGAKLWRSGAFVMGPFASIDWQSVSVEGYQEQGMRATAMNFADQERDSLLLEAGAFMDYRHAAWQLHGRLSYVGELEDGARNLRAGLNSLPGSQFTLYDIQPSSDYWAFDLGVNGTLSSGVSLGLAYALRQGERDDAHHLVSAFIQVDLP